MKAYKKTEKVFPFNTEFKRGKYHYSLCKYVAPYAIYDQSDESGVVAYEVVKLRKIKLRATKRGHTRLLMKGFTHMVEYPSSSQWGKYGFTYMSYFKALDKLNELVRSLTDKKLKAS